jgi:hypothetical protein
MTQRDAYDLDAEIRGQAFGANVLFGVAGALAISGAAIWWFGGPRTGSAIAILPTGQGLSVGGTWP